MSDRSIACYGLLSSASLVKQAILDDDLEFAREIAADLLGNGYYEPGFIRICTQYRLCAGGA